jgi:hypothetical protein
MRGLHRELKNVSLGIAALCHRKTELMCEQAAFRGYPRVEWVLVWNDDLARLEKQRRGLLREQRFLRMLASLE